MQVRENMQEAVFRHSLDNPDQRNPIWCIIVAHKYKGKYRIESTRLPSWDYASPGFYFVTICTQAKAPYFGEVTDEEMHLSPSGAIVSDEWLKTGQIRTYIRENPLKWESDLYHPHRMPSKL
jgi:hypothetical protein